MKGVSADRRPYRMLARANAAEATLHRVLDAAVELFTDHPYEEVSLDLVAAQAGVSKRTILRRFGSKEALFGESLQRAVDEMIRHREAAPVGRRRTRDLPAQLIQDRPDLLRARAIRRPP